MTSSAGRLLGEADPPPVEALRLSGRSPFLLLCEHAGDAVPASLSQLDLPAEELKRHIGWDIGAGELTRQLSALLDAPALLQRYSRLVIDCNRPRHSPSLAPVFSDGTRIPGNAGLNPAEVDERWDAIHRPFHELARRLLDERPRSLLVCIHSFTPCLRSDPGQDRSMHMALLHGSDARLALAISEGLEAEAGRLRLAFNAPYAIDDETDYSIPVHGLGRGIPNVLIEIRQDLLETPDGRLDWARRLHRALTGPAVAQLIQETSA